MVPLLKLFTPKIETPKIYGDGLVTCRLLSALRKTATHGGSKAAIYNLTTLCLNGTLSCVDFVYVIMGDIPPWSDVNHPIIFNREISERLFRGQDLHLPWSQA